jgi:hypothetical protein
MSKGTPLIILVLAGMLLSCSAASAALSPYDGSMTFQAIQGPSDPEEYSWEVELGPGQYLEQVDDRNAQVYFEGGHTAFGITAALAHDAEGSNVPTTLAVSAPNVITLTVHHRAGNSAAGGASFVYPISGGEGWEGGFHTEFIQGPPDENELREARERVARERTADAASKEACRVPQLRGRTLAASRRSLARSGCRIGRVRRGKATSAKPPRVVDQSPKAGVVLTAGASVRVTLGS